MTFKFMCIDCDDSNRRRFHKSPPTEYVISEWTSLTLAVKHIQDNPLHDVEIILDED